MSRLAIDGGLPQRATPLHYGHQYIDEADIAAVEAVLRSDYLTCGPKIGELEDKLCEVSGAKYAVAVSNGTAALHAACFAANIGTGDEVITTAITFAASANCALYCGATPVFADIDGETYNISPKEVAKKITRRTRAVVAVDFTGQAVQLDELRKLCEQNKLVLIEDAAHSIGTKYKGCAVGSIADMTTFSFHPVKTVTSGEGGAITTNDARLHEKLLLFRAHGITRSNELMAREPDGSWYYEQILLGYNYRMTDLQAALLISQLEKLERFSMRRKEIVACYNAAFLQMPQIFVQKEIPESNTTRHLYILRLRPETLRADRRQIFDALTAENICCNVHYIPVYTFPYYQELGYPRGLCPQAESLYQNSLTLPLYYGMTDQDVDDVIAAVRKVIDTYKI